MKKLSKIISRSASRLPIGASRKDIARIKNKATGYSESFSIIGLTRVFTGNPIERFFWFAILLVAIILGFHMSRELMTKYQKKDVRIDKQTVLADNNFFPSVTVCVKPPRKKMYCGYNIIERPQNIPAFKGPCDEDFTEHNTNRTYEPTFNGVSMTTGYFTVQCQARGICQYFKTFDKKYFKIDPQFPECLIWNYNGDFYNDENRLDLEISINSSISRDIYDKDKDDIRVYVNHKSLYTPLQYNYLTTSMYQHFQLSFKKVMVKRLPSPYTSKCVTSSPQNIFPGDYSLEHCMASKRCLGSFKKCGGSYDFCDLFIPKEFRQKYKQRKNISDMHRCLQDSYYDNRRVTDCDLPCDETVFEIYGSSYHFKEDPNNSRFKLSMRFEEPYTFRMETEEELYSWGDLLGGVGGNVGLFCGFSMLSLVEILSFVVLRLWAKFAKKKLLHKERVMERRSRAEFPDVDFSRSSGDIPMHNARDFDGNNGNGSDEEKEKGEEHYFPNEEKDDDENENKDEIKGERLYYSQTLI